MTPPAGRPPLPPDLAAALRRAWAAVFEAELRRELRQPATGATPELFTGHLSLLYNGVTVEYTEQERGEWDGGERGDGTSQTASVRSVGATLAPATEPAEGGRPDDDHHSVARATRQGEGGGPPEATV